MRKRRVANRAQDRVQVALLVLNLAKLGEDPIFPRPKSVGQALWVNCSNLPGRCPLQQMVSLP
jgi:hypothetical protein